VKKVGWSDPKWLVPTALNFISLFFLVKRFKYKLIPKFKVERGRKLSIPFNGIFLLNRRRWRNEKMEENIKTKGCWEGEVLIEQYKKMVEEEYGKNPEHVKVSIQHLKEIVKQMEKIATNYCAFMPCDYCPRSLFFKKLLEAGMFERSEKNG
jgi:hypothetical protein